MTSHELARKLLDMPDCQMIASIDAENITGNDNDKIFANSVIEISHDKRRKTVELHFEESDANFKLIKEERQ